MNHNDFLTQVAVLPQVLDAATCARAIKLAKSFPATEGRVGTGDVEQGKIRRSQIWFFDPSPQTDFIFAPLRGALKLINQGYNFDIDGFGTGCQIARYSSDDLGHYDWHIDLGTGRFSRRKIRIIFTPLLSPLCRVRASYIT
jgi:PKHD-type hydroxylase